MHVLSVATVGPTGEPRSRMVVLRSTDRAAWSARVYADVRTAKISEIAMDPRVALTAYDPADGVQIRLQGLARTFTGDEVAAAAWRNVPPFSRIGYRIEPAPATPLDEGGAFDLSEVDGRTGFESFAVLEVAVRRLEWLSVAPTGHRRAAFWRDGRMTWLAP